MFRLNSIRLNHSKNTAEIKTVPLPAPSYVKIPMAMHMGAPCTPRVKKGDRVVFSSNSQLDLGVIVGTTDTTDLIEFVD